MTTAAFQRARKPEEISIRREAILAAAAALFDAEGPEGAGLNAIAAKAGFTKSNVYRYFESREAVLLSLFVDELNAMTGELAQDLSAVAPGDLPATARITAAAFIAHPRLCHLMSILSGVIEHNVSEAAIIDLKRETFGLTARVSGALARCLPGLSPADCAWAASMIAALVAGLWPGAHPAPVAAKVLAMPEFCDIMPVMARDLERAVLALLRGVVAG